MTDWQPPQFGLQTPRFNARTEFTHPTRFLGDSLLVGGDGTQVLFELGVRGALCFAFPAQPERSGLESGVHKKQEEARWRLEF
jgi:hypothetical protein